MKEAYPLYGLSRITKDPLDSGASIAGALMQTPDGDPGLISNLKWEAILYYFDATKEQKYLDHVLKVWETRKKNEKDQINRDSIFSCLHFETYLRTSDDGYLHNYMDHAEVFLNEWSRNNEGAVIQEQAGPARMMLEILQGFTVFMARAGWLSGDEKYFRECTRQYQIYKDKLRNPSTGLWHHGSIFTGVREEISAGHWARSQGWLIRGLVDCLDYLPYNSPYWIEVWELLLDLVFYLKKHQDERGMWHQLTDRQDAYPETGGTALLVHYLWKAIHRGWLDEQKHKAMVVKALDALLGYIHADGTLSNTSLTTGPLQEADAYLHRPAIPGDPVGTALALMACSIPHTDKVPGDRA